MKKSLSVWLAFMTSTFAFALAVPAKSLDWKDPEAFRINKEPARSFFYTSDNS